MDFTEYLVQDVAIIVFTFLDGPELHCAMSCCRRWSLLIRNQWNWIWKKVVYRKFSRAMNFLGEDNTIYLFAGMNKWGWRDVYFYLRKARNLVLKQGFREEARWWWLYYILLMDQDRYCDIPFIEKHLVSPEDISKITVCGDYLTRPPHLWKMFLSIFYGNRKKVKRNLLLSSMQNFHLQVRVGSSNPFR